MESFCDENDEDVQIEMRSIEAADGKTVVSDEYGIKEPDLRLMAAAPEMLEALKELQLWASEQALEKFAEKIGRVIAKVEGRLKPMSRVIQLTKHSQDGNATDTVTFLALCEDGSIWFYFPALENKWEFLSEMENGKYIC